MRETWRSLMGNLAMIHCKLRAASYAVVGSNVTTVRYTELASDRFKDFWR
jgi:hypothetical protein